MDHLQIARCFNRRFGRCPASGAVLIGGAPEPLYLPATPERPAIIRYTRDHAASALHEIAHWSLADTQRRQRLDYGMWYRPPPRSVEDQARFFAAEVPVQALEMLLARATGVDFHVSADNPGADDPIARDAFTARVEAAFAALLVCGPSAVAVAVLDALNPAWQARLELTADVCGAPSRNGRWRA